MVNSFEIIGPILDINVIAFNCVATCNMVDWVWVNLVSKV